jgi:hypothetical protein
MFEVLSMYLKCNILVYEVEYTCIPYTIYRYTIRVLALRFAFQLVTHHTSICQP